MKKAMYPFQKVVNKHKKAKNRQNNQIINTNFKQILNIHKNHRNLLQHLFILQREFKKVIVTDLKNLKSNFKDLKVTDIPNNS